MQRLISTRSNLIRSARCVQMNLKNKSTTAQASGAKETSFLEFLTAADQNMSHMKILHKTNYAVAVLAPLAIVAHPSALSMPVDIALAIVFPLHAHIGMNCIFTDYVPGSPTSGARYALLGVSLLTSLGLMKLSFTDEGIVGSLKSLWVKKEDKEEN
eukprot:maker-scaffold_1-snap-gene-26.53-mRNA-1 protein AED:0.02 eAED:0.02 QI:104/1/1/1/0.75/0.6/5/1139/156